MDELTPWDDLADAFARLDDARRHGTAADVAAAEADAERARDRVAALGNLLILFALDRCGMPLQKRLAAVFDELARAAWQKAKIAHHRANWACDELDALRQRVRELETRIDSLTPGVGVPGLRVFG